jgi:uncharacterized protein
LIITTDDKGDKAAAVDGGMMKRQMREHHITNYISVNSVDEYSSKVEKLGGKVFAPKYAVPGMGYFAVIQKIMFSLYGSLTRLQSN